ncbi:MAG: C25 family cysteine peptidase [Polyangiales bacterium]
MKMRWGAVGCVALALGVTFSAGSARAQCSTADADMNGIPDVCPAGTTNVIIGDATAETLTGTNGIDCIFGMDGADTINGLGGNDYICGGGGNDTINGGSGDDVIYGGSGRDVIDGGAGSDQLHGGTAGDTLRGGSGPDILYGDSGNDTLEGGPGNDTLWGGVGLFDSADGGNGTDNCLQAATNVNCELFSHALVASFGALLDDGAVVLRWVTVSESATVGFYLYREVDGSWVQIHEGLLPALLGAPQGGIYDLRDSSALPGQSNRYLLVEVDMNGVRTDHGPFEVSANLESTTMLRAGVTFAREPHVVDRRLAQPKALSGERQRPGDAVGIFLGVPATGVYSVPSIEIAARLGLTDKAVQERLQDGSLELTQAGAPVAWTASPDGSALRFLGFAPDSSFSLERFYHLRVGAGTQMERLSRPPLGVGSQVAFIQTVHAEEDLIPGILVAEDGRVDFWFWQFASASPSMPEQVAVEIDLEGVVPDGVDALVRVELHGISNVVHEAEVELNGVTLGTAIFEGAARHVAQWTIPASGLVEGSNALRIAAKGSGESMFYFDSAEIVFERSYETSASALELTSVEDSPIAVVGSFGDDVLLFEISNPVQPRILDDYAMGAVSNGSEVAFEAGTGEAYFATAVGSVRGPSSIWNDLGSDLHNSANRAEYLVIAPAPLYESARALVEYRQADGLQAMLVEMQDVFDEFAAGEPDPEAIRSFLRYARDRWAVPPRYVTLIGKGSLDYRDLWGAGGNLLPPIMVHTQKGLYSADNHFGDFEGTDNVPEIALGRLPVSTPEELDAIVSRIAAYEASLDGLGDSILLLADENDERSHFDAASDALAAHLGADWTFARIYHSELSVELFRSKLFEELARSPRLVHYLGHGGLNLLGKTGELFQADDVQNIQLGGAQPIYMLMTCSTSRFEVPGLVSLGEALVLDANGAVAVWGPSGESIDEQAQALARHALDAILSPGDVRLGDALLAAYATVVEGDGREDMPAVYHLFGDPALRVAKAADLVGPGDPEPPGNQPPVPGASPSATGGTGCTMRTGGAGSTPFFWLLMSGLLLLYRRRH